ncbi:MAG: LytR C-terminal domain-containing protein [Candidatus Fermentibacteraceae bacterium]|nr:LytR C-terminal domain-containing protein [Candidatus Fermentibacteraceae bacterium]MBN2608026.1 LytR C-terminal domain-containing protein [Candidatus Fermentibacteraceae bacterium]
MTSVRGFPWRWVIACLAIAVVAITILVPPPGADEEESPTEQPAATSDTVAHVQAPELSVPDTVRVLVLNGTFIDGLAGRTQMLLLRSSSDSTVVLAPFDPSDAPEKPYEETIVISHLQDLSSAAAVASILGLEDDCIVWEVPPAGVPVEIDVTVCLGRDLGGEFPESE